MKTVYELTLISAESPHLWSCFFIRESKTASAAHTHLVPAGVKVETRRTPLGSMHHVALARLLALNVPAAVIHLPADVFRHFLM